MSSNEGVEGGVVRVGGAGKPGQRLPKGDATGGSIPSEVAIGALGSGPPPPPPPLTGGCAGQKGNSFDGGAAIEAGDWLCSCGGSSLVTKVERPLPHLLHLVDHLSGVRRVDAVVTCAGGEESPRVSHPVRKPVVGAVPLQRRRCGRGTFVGTKGMRRGVRRDTGGGGGAPAVGPGCRTRPSSSHQPRACCTCAKREWAEWRGGRGGRLSPYWFVTAPNGGALHLPNHMGVAERWLCTSVQDGM
eukprot:scaffold16564_cov136-Isochrysis_galbana.AAC.2